MPRLLSILLSATLACASAPAQESEPDPPQPSQTTKPIRPQTGGFLPPKINWVNPPTPQPSPTPTTPTQPNPAQPQPSTPNPLPFQPPPLPEITRVAMALPTEAPGLVGRAAESFHQGCAQGVRSQNARLWIDLYPAADPQAELAAYESAIANNAQFIIGPMSKSGVRAVLESHPDSKIPTLLLQPPPPEFRNGENYFVMTLDSAREAAALARFLAAAGATRAVVVARESPLGKRQAAAFAAAWREAADEYPLRFSVRAPAEDERDDLRAMFNEFKSQTESETELDDPPAPPAVFIAGNSEFTRRARSYLPARYPAYAGSVARAPEDGPDALQMEGLRFLEIPWLARPETADFGEAESRALTERRFFALGADACRAALRAQEWSVLGNGWTFQGAAGNFTLRDNEFLREGELAEYRDGRAAAVAGPRATPSQQ